ncbi:MAG: SDR family oxidoreductase [Caldisphaera sp.]|jgi:NAD(P)-dependent dehydrogenase (short-subunit alcohol dehydrogenase family)|nr:SDR family oxidoreductase [Caldisphaera sp.]PMP60540.1 MAG: sugar dehydrogenase [Caldisphaera sp.]PMP89646.1 MAG: sugar dehydrogenase [Caldisphaera sp.]
MNNKCNALVTSSSRGIGFQAALSLIEKGCNVVINSRSLENIENAIKKLKEMKRDAIIYGIKADISSIDEVKKLYDETQKILGSLDIIVMNYGNPLCEPCELIRTNYDDWLYSFNLYVASTVEMIKQVYLKNDRKVSFVLISSFSTYSPMESTSLSDIIRSVFPSLVKVYSRLYPNKIRANLLLLGTFKTEGAMELIRKLSSKENIDENEYWKRFVEDISPLKRSGRFDELREVISWLSFSPEYLSGSIILFDGATLNCLI